VKDNIKGVADVLQDEEKASWYPQPTGDESIDNAVEAKRDEAV
jgi:hypothetical protein